MSKLTLPKSRWLRLLLAVAILFILFYVLLPHRLFNTPYSYVLTDRDGQLLQARIAADGQWRFPPRTQVPDKFKQAIITFEDKRFSYHPGVDPAALGRSLYQNIKHRRVVSGGSTLTMQVARLAQQQPRTLLQKIWEMLLALRLELSYSKNDILALYAAHAPFGGNVVGLDAAAWRYFGRSPEQLSWAESAMLAVLPNNPAIIRLDRNRKQLLLKRNLLLTRMQAQGIIDAGTCALALAEPIPDKPFPLPELAPHLLSSVASGKIPRAHKSNLIQSTISLPLQVQVNALLQQHHRLFEANGINNAAALVMDIEKGYVLAYAGNVYRPEKPDYDSYVDVIQAPRSPGSTLKPLLYAAMLHDGLLLPNTLVADIPTQVAGYAPQNFDLGYDGAVPASRALARSLNVPAIRMLQQYRIERFYELLQHLGVTTLHHPSGHYGLSLILGGGENTLWELSGIYGSLARVLNHYPQYQGRYRAADLFMPRIEATNEAPLSREEVMKLPQQFSLGAGAIYHTFDAMKEVMRPGEEQLWTQFNSARRIAWKTGTSFGFRDGWAIGLTPGHLVAVWVGNADGEGRPGLTGINFAAPLLFDIFKLLPASGWFAQPHDDLSTVVVCKQSGYRATALCVQTDSMAVPPAGQRTPPCPYHQLVHLNEAETHQVTDACLSPQQMVHRSWFVLPPAMEWYYQRSHADYRTLPPYAPGCQPQQSAGVMEMIYPRKSNSIYVPVELSGEKGKCVFEVAHRQKHKAIYWHIDEAFIGTTREFHQMELNPEPGKHRLVLVDESGERLEQYFEVLSR